mmetsp:Transcript_13787/g.33946  ORF Transcript_13787/g.33946 Transcript_13787/m.33946 type:complete len:256 (-) Transcript_13787:486-1253(-)
MLLFSVSAFFARSLKFALFFSTTPMRSLCAPTSTNSCLIRVAISSPLEKLRAVPKKIDSFRSRSLCSSSTDFAADFAVAAGSSAFANAAPPRPTGSAFRTASSSSGGASLPASRRIAFFSCSRYSPDRCNPLVSSASSSTEHMLYCTSRTNIDESSSLSFASRSCAFRISCAIVSSFAACVLSSLACSLHFWHSIAPANAPAAADDEPRPPGLAPAPPPRWPGGGGDAAATARIDWLFLHLRPADGSFLHVHLRL